MIPPAGPLARPAGPLIPPAVDVLVAGGGAAGLTAALAAAAAGASVLLAERGDRLGGTTALSGGRVWIPGNHLSGAEDPPDAAARYLDGIFSGRYPQMISAFLRSAPEMARFVERHSPHRFAACPRYPDYDPGRPGATAGGRSLDMTPIDVSKLTPLVADILVPPGYLPLSFAEWERWRVPAALRLGTARPAGAQRHPDGRCGAGRRAARRRDPGRRPGGHRSPPDRDRTGRVELAGPWTGDGSARPAWSTRASRSRWPPGP